MTCFSSGGYTAPLPVGHVFPMGKFAASAKAVGEFAEVVDPGGVSDEDLYRVHTREYVRSIRTGAYNEVTRLKLGLPWSPELSRRSHLATNGTVRAARVAMREGRGDGGRVGLACNLAGGTHHAFPDSGQGFCVFNDVAVAIRALLADDPWYQVLVVDLDAHQGNGTNAIFAGEPGVFTYSVHGGRNYPSAKVPGRMDVELPRWVGAGEYFERLAATLPGVVRGHEPDVAFYIAGVDVHEDDRFGQMRLTTEDMRRRDQWTIDLLRDAGVPTVVVYGGGYNRTEGMTAELHVQTVREAARRFAAERVR